MNVCRSTVKHVQKMNNNNNIIWMLWTTVLVLFCSAVSMFTVTHAWKLEVSTQINKLNISTSMYDKHAVYNYFHSISKTIFQWWYSSILCFAAHLEHLTMCKKEKEQTTTPISLGVVCCRVYLSTIWDFSPKLNVPSELKSTVYINYIHCLFKFY